MKLIVGLGNPGANYVGTRHNVGFDVVDVLADRWRINLASERFHAWFGVGECGQEKVALAKPSTFMNRSGQSVAAAGRFYKLEFVSLLVILDDLALPVGRIRLRATGSAGSHNGLQDIIDRSGTLDFPRLRIGIGSAIGVPSHYVLGRFDDDEKPVMSQTRIRAADCVECWVRHGIESAMTRFNGESPES